jgi:hypothetical protein
MPLQSIVVEPAMERVNRLAEGGMMAPASWLRISLARASA